MNWGLLSMGVVAIGIIGWIILAARKECARMNSK